MSTVGGPIGLLWSKSILESRDLSGHCHPFMGHQIFCCVGIRPTLFCLLFISKIHRKSHNWRIEIASKLCINNTYQIIKWKLISFSRDTLPLILIGFLQFQSVRVKNIDIFLCHYLICLKQWRPKSILSIRFHESTPFLA